MRRYSRYGNKWTVNEVLSLQREFELLGLDLDEIASKHKRTVNAIMCKLDQEGFADYNVLYSNYHNLNAEMPITRKPTDDLYFNDVEDEEDESEDYEPDDDVEKLSDRVCGLEDSVNEIKDMLKQLMTYSIYQKPKEHKDDTVFHVGA